ncbi:MAG TPA: hypothetical protein C5S37_07150 [Methanophagales archaeon]|nr:hypothetical protein [Methanophagales archaeon]
MIENKNKGLKLLVCLSIIAVLITVTSVVSAQVPPPENDVIVEVTPGSQTGAPGDTLMFNVILTNNGTVPDIIVVDSIAGVPSGWTVDLKDAGVPQALPYQTPLLQSKTNYILILNVHLSSSSSAGTSNMSINVHSFADNSKTDRAIVSANVLIQASTPTAYHGDSGRGRGAASPKVTPTSTVVITRTPIMTPMPETMPVLTPTPSPIETPTPKPWWKIPGFEVVFAILALLAVAYLLRKRKK